MIREHTVTKSLIESYYRTMAKMDGNVNHGMVSAWLKIPGQKRMVWGRAYRDPRTDMWTHGERACVENALRKIYGPNFKGRKLPKGCEMIVTLEPCTMSMAKRRGCSCSDLLKFHDIKTVYCGAEDPKHFDAQGNPPSHSFNMFMATDPAAVKRCEELRSYIPGLND
jgi:tRNA(Arg) A34 adenosine deaminase TadA